MTTEAVRTPPFPKLPNIPVVADDMLGTSEAACNLFRPTRVLPVEVVSVRRYPPRRGTENQGAPTPIGGGDQR